MNTPATPEIIEFAWCCCPKWATAASSDVVDVIERGDGVGTVLMIDVQGSGSSGSRLAHTLINFARDITAAGSEPSVVATATAQFLYSIRGGSVSASIHVIRAHPSSNLLSLTGYGNCSLARSEAGAWETIDFHHASAGTILDHSPGTLSIQFMPGATILIANDGIARDRSGLETLVADSVDFGSVSNLVSQVVTLAIDQDGGRSKSDMATAAIARKNATQPALVNSGFRMLPVRSHRSAL